MYQVVALITRAQKKGKIMKPSNQKVVAKANFPFVMVCIWGSLVKFQGGGVVVKTMLGYVGVCRDIEVYVGLCRSI